MSLLDPQLAAFSAVLKEAASGRPRGGSASRFGAMRHAITEIVASCRLCQNARTVRIAWDGMR
ncbi:MAG: hypothetical protein ABWY09_17295 [Stenotrophomonas maltophilia]